MSKYTKYHKEYYKRNKEKINKHNSTVFESRLYSSCKSRANKNGYEFNLTLEDIKIPDICIYLGIPLTREYGNGKLFSNASIDRIDSSKGYTKDNIQIISLLANRMKQNATKEQLIEFAKRVLTMYE